MTDGQREAAWQTARKIARECWQTYLLSRGTDAQTYCAAEYDDAVRRERVARERWLARH